MALQKESRLFSIDEYLEMIDRGVFAPDDRIELIRGEIVSMPPIGDNHAFCVADLDRLFNRLVNDKAIVWSQNPIRLNLSDSRPQPDLVLLRPRSDLSAKSPPTSQDVLLLIEVAETTIRYDRGKKLKLYAEDGIPEYWIVNLQGRVIEVYSSPAEGEYKQVRQAKRGETLTLPGGLEGTIKVEEILA